MNQIRLNLARQRHRKAVDVDFARGETFRLQEDLMPLLVREANDLVLKRRTIPRSDTADLAVEERRAIDVRADQIAHAIVRVQQVAVNLRTLDRRARERKRHRRNIPVLDRKTAGSHLAVEIDTRPVQPRRRSRFQPAAFKAECFQRVGQLARRRLVRPAGRPLLPSNVHQTVQKCPGRHDQRAASIRIALFGRKTYNAPA